MSNENKNYYKLCLKLRLLYAESYAEKGKEFDPYDERLVFQDYTLYPERFYKNVIPLFDASDKKYDFCFVGGLNTDLETTKNRKWILRFIMKHFSQQSYLQFTDRGTKINHKKMGPFDYTLLKNGFVPKYEKKDNKNLFDQNYFDILSKSKFCLCPAGDKIYSMRFYEALMCGSIPVVKIMDESFRSKAESKLDYKFYCISNMEKTDKFIYKEDWARHNYEIFLNYHTLNSIECQ